MLQFWQQQHSKVQHALRLVSGCLRCSRWALTARRGFMTTMLGHHRCISTTKVTGLLVHTHRQRHSSQWVRLVCRSHWLLWLERRIGAGAVF